MKVDIAVFNIFIPVSYILKVPVDTFNNFDEEQAINIILNTFNDQSNGYNYYPTFNVNPVEKWVESLDEIKRLNAEIIKVKDEQIALLEGLLGDKSGSPIKSSLILHLITFLQK